MIDKNSQEAQGYITQYRSKIKGRFLDNKKSKDELISTLGGKNLIAEKDREIDMQYKDDIKKFVNELKSEDNFVVYQEKYHEDMNEIRKLLNDAIAFDSRKGPKNKRDFITKLFPEAKKAAFEDKGFDWDDFVKQLGGNMLKLKKTEKEKVLGSLSGMFASKESMIKAIRELKDGLKESDTNSRIAYMASVLCILTFIGVGVGMVNQESNSILIKILGYLMSVNGIKSIGKATKNIAIIGGNNEVIRKLKPHRYDYDSGDITTVKV